MCCRNVCFLQKVCFLFCLKGKKRRSVNRFKSLLLKLLHMDLILFFWVCFYTFSTVRLFFFCFIFFMPDLETKKFTGKRKTFLFLFYLMFGLLSSCTIHPHFILNFWTNLLCRQIRRQEGTFCFSWPKILDGGHGLLHAIFFNILFKN